MCYNKTMNWDKITDIMVYAAIATVGIFAIMGLYQWITRKSLKKVDKAIWFLLVPLALMIIVYFLFDHVFIWNTRPDGSGEPSFPSTHTMIAATVFFCTAVILPRYIKQKPLVACLDLAMLVFVVLVPVGRILANKHWASDCVGGLIFAAIFAGIYILLVAKFADEPEKKPEKALKKDSKKEAKHE